MYENVSVIITESDVLCIYTKILKCEFMYFKVVLKNNKEYFMRNLL
jgi:hypothetical protein